MLSVVTIVAVIIVVAIAAVVLIFLLVLVFVFFLVATVVLIIGVPGFVDGRTRPYDGRHDHASLPSMSSSAQPASAIPANKASINFQNFLFMNPIPVCWATNSLCTGDAADVAEIRSGIKLGAAGTALLPFGIPFIGGPGAEQIHQRLGVMEQRNRKP